MKVAFGSLTSCFSIEWDFNKKLYFCPFLEPTVPFKVKIGHQRMKTKFPKNFDDVVKYFLYNRMENSLPVFLCVGLS